MGRYESQRAIAARTIYERRQGRKRGLAWVWWTVARLAALALTVAALLAAAWFAPLLNQAPADHAPSAEPWLPAIEPSADLPAEPAAEPAAQPTRRAIRRAHRAPAAAAAPAADQFSGAEVLSLDELDTISQAH